MPKIIFVPNRTESTLFGAPRNYFLRTSAKHRIDSWSCQKTANPGDLYIFYFGAPSSEILGIGICKESPDQKGWKKRGWTNRQKMFFCPFRDVYKLTNVIHESDLKAHKDLSKWWSGRPYRGRPKALDESYANALIRLIAQRNKRNKNLTKILNPFLAGTRTPSTIKRRDKSDSNSNGNDTEAFEGTEHERIVRDRRRSAQLRNARIAQAKKMAGGRLICEVPGCGFDFYTVYGELGRDYIHVHHRKQLAKRRGRGRTTLKDLAVVCANCHAMIHKGGACRTLDKLVSTVHGGRRR